MNSIFNAFYLAIFIRFLRELVGKISLPLEYSVRTESRNHTDEFYVMVLENPVYWTDDKNDALDFVYHALRRCRTLHEKLSIVEDRDLPLVDIDIMEGKGLSHDEVIAIDDTIDELDCYE